MRVLCFLVLQENHPIGVANQCRRRDKSEGMAEDFKQSLAPLAAKSRFPLTTFLYCLDHQSSIKSIVAIIRNEQERLGTKSIGLSL